MKKYSLMLIVGILFQNQIIHTADIYTDTFFNNPSETITLDRNTRDICTDRFADATLYCASLACSLPRWSLNTAFCPGQALIAAKLWDVNPTTCQIKMDDFKNVQ